jgi:hypothetical protein
MSKRTTELNDDAEGVLRAATKPGLASRDGWLPKARPPPAGTGSSPHACVRTSYQPAHPVKLSKLARKHAQQRWRGLLKRIAKQVRATLGDALWADFVSYAATRATRTPS